MGEEAVNDDEEDELGLRRDEGPEEEHAAGEEDAGDEDVEDAAAFGDEPGGDSAAEEANGVETHDEVEALGFGDVDYRCAEDGDLLLEVSKKNLERVWVRSGAVRT